jgi:hypothetical protein
MKARRNKVVKFGSAVLYALESKSVIKTHLGQIYNEMCVVRGRVPVVPMKELIDQPREIRLYDFLPEEGNVSALELLCLCLLVRRSSARVVLELGTYNGNTALQLAANAGDAAVVITVDLPPGAQAPEQADNFDSGCVDSVHRGQLRFVGTDMEQRIRPVAGNTLELDFASLCQPAKPDLIFIDAGHSYECVRNDSEKSLGVLASGGTIVWHDYSQTWPGVYNYLNELAGTLPLVNIAGTSLVVYSSIRSRINTPFQG